MKKVQIKKGDVFICKEDYIMNDDSVAYSKDKKYMSNHDGSLQDNEGNSYHVMENERDFWEFFEKIESPPNHIMVDIETMGTKSFSAIISIAAVKFNIDTGKVGHEFYREVSLKSNLNLGLNVEEETVKWWDEQSEDARGVLTSPLSIPIIDALEHFSLFCDSSYEIWGNSARFDLGLLENAYNKAGIDIPWDFRKERCVRTLVSFNPEIKRNLAFKGVVHNALHDCYHQIKYCHLTWNTLKKQ